MRKRSRYKKSFPYFALAAFFICAMLLAARLLILFPAAPGLTRLASLSAMLTVPDGARALLERRFFGEYELYIDDDSESKPEPLPPRPPDEDSPDIEEPAPGENIPEIPEEYRGTLLEENLSGYDNPALVRTGAGYLHNYTKITHEDILSILEKANSVKLEASEEPQVLILHTHATEAFEEYDNIYYDKRNNWRSTDNTKNMVRVGDELAAVLEEHGIAVLHDDTQHDNPSYNGSYNRSAKTVSEYLKEYPSIRVIFDLHRDGIERENNVIVKPTVTIDGQKAAQLMIIAGADDGTMDMPKWKTNLRFAAAIQNAVEEDWPMLTRPIFFCYRRYNMHLSTGALLLEFGSSANTLEEALYTARLAGSSIARVLLEGQEE